MIASRFSRWSRSPVSVAFSSSDFSRLWSCFISLIASILMNSASADPRALRGGAFIQSRQLGNAERMARHRRLELLTRLAPQLEVRHVERVGAELIAVREMCRRRARSAVAGVAEAVRQHLAGRHSQLVAVDRDVIREA